MRAFAFLGLMTLAAVPAASAFPAPQSQTRPPAGQGTAPAGQTTPGQPPVAGQPGAAGQPPAPPPAVPASRKFTSDGGILFNVVKPDKTADFEAVMARVKEALAKSDNPKRKQMALSWRVFKSLETGLGGNYVYVFWFDPPVKDEDYQITMILGEAFPNELMDLWAKFTQSLASPQTMINLQQVVNMSPNATTNPK